VQLGQFQSEKGIQVTSRVRLGAFVDAADLPFAMLADRQEYFPRPRRSAGPWAGTDADVVDSSANGPRNEMIFEHLAPSCYLCGPSSSLLRQSASASRALDKLPAEDMHRAVLNISRVYAEICETAERALHVRLANWVMAKGPMANQPVANQPME